MVAVLMLSAAALGGCSPTPLPTAPESRRAADRLATTTETADPAAGSRPYHIETRVRAASHTMEAGSEVELTLSVTNHERNAITLYFASGCKLLFVVRDEDGKPANSSWFCAAIPSHLTLQPNQTLEKKTSWRAARFVYVPDGSHYEPLPPGRYIARAYLANRAMYLSAPCVLNVTPQKGA
jgi:hypothetical protein